MSEATNSSIMTGAQAVTGTLANLGVTACFANPGTSEMHLVTALDGEPRIRSVLCLFEGVATGAADGFARISGEPAMTLLHLGAGYLNAGANIHNARRAHSPMINVIGDHAIPHLKYDAPLTSNITGLAAPNSNWIKSVGSSGDAGKLATEAWAASFGPKPGPVSLLLPADTAWLEGGVIPANLPKKPALYKLSDSDIEAAAKALRAAKSPILLINGTALGHAGLTAAARLKSADIRIMTDTFYGKMARGAGRFAPDRMQYFAEGAMADMDGADLMVIAGTQAPVAFFSYPEKPSLLVPEGCTTHLLGGPESDSADTLRRLAGALDIMTAAPFAKRADHACPTGDLNAQTIGISITRHLPDNAFVSDDGVSNSLWSFLPTAEAAPHDWMMLTGGAIGQGLPLALGAAIAAPDRKGLCITGDGAAMYTNQALWSMARENADVVTVVFVNHSYRILNIELARTGAGKPGPIAASMLGLGQPEIDWVALSESLGVPAIGVSTAEAFDAALETAFAEDGPRLIAANII